jgi:hypothetical protein
MNDPRPCSPASGFGCLDAVDQFLVGPREVFIVDEDRNVAAMTGQ